MKVLYIPSGYGQIYTSFDLSIERALKKVGLDVLKIDYSDEKLTEKIEIFQPHIAITMVGFQLPLETTHLLKEKGIILVAWFTEDPYYVDQSIKIIDRYDFIFTIDLAALQIYKASGHPHVYHLPLGTDPDIFYAREPQEKYRSDICLIGYPYPNRIRLIKSLIKETKLKVILVGKQWEKELYNQDDFKRLRVISQWVPPSIVNLYFNGAKINVNTHRPNQFKRNKNKRKISSLSINNRTFDIACSHSFQLTDFRDDLYSHFSKKEIIHFENIDHFLQLTHYFLTNEKERLSFAEKSNKNVLKNHTFYHRMVKLISILKQH